ncbi:C6 zinc finger domain protein [Purpureocillium lavendulum]|uniref:C6 zinc finger domain protein n=1 Tax=Purpureocillium lavendulum TaxID=1247861 RepID=A0AB34G637_9HYPO|nr:C6 zinc finger domain protein [Purpureocillium lavendulum]
MTTDIASPVPSSVLKQPVKLACVQLTPGADKAANLRCAASRVAEAARSGARIVVLPELFNSLNGCKFFAQYAENLSPPSPEQSPSFYALSAMAADNKVYLVGGSIPEADPDTGKYFNTCLVFGPGGELLDKFRKIHLFDIDIPGKITFRESDVLSPGNRIALVSLPEYGTIAVAICYDIRFPELATIATRNGAFALIYPSAFTLTTGALHWQLLARARALDNQIYVVMCSPARDMSGPYHAWGHSMIVDPMAKVLVEADETDTIIEAELDGESVMETRRNIPLNNQRRFDVYPDAELKMPIPKIPEVFMKPAGCLNNPLDPIRLPASAPEAVDAEVELAVIIGQDCKNVEANSALEYVLGYTIANDLTARDMQSHTSQWVYCKGYDGFCPLGPVVMEKFFRMGTRPR